MACAKGWRCFQECTECRFERLKYDGCECPGCAPQRAIRYESTQSPVEFARTVGIIYRQERQPICTARKNVLGGIVPMYSKEAI